MIRMRGSNGTDIGQFKSSKGIAVDPDGFVYITDGSNTIRKIQKFTGGGRFISRWGTEGTSVGQLRGPRGITSNSSGKLFIAEEGSKRIQIYSTVPEPPTVVIATRQGGQATVS